MKITVYCGANPGNKFQYQEATIELGKWLVDNNYTLVYGGGSVGLMGLICDTVMNNGGKAIGIIPEFLKARESIHPLLEQEIVVETMSERKNLLLEKGDVCLALPGGPGTLEEITEVYSWARIGKNDRPCILYNVDGYYDSLKEVYDHMVEEGFLSIEDRKLLHFPSTILEIEDIIKPINKLNKYDD